MFISKCPILSNVMVNAVGSNFLIHLQEAETEQGMGEDKTQKETKSHHICNALCYVLSCYFCWVQFLFRVYIMIIHYCYLKILYKVYVWKQKMYAQVYLFSSKYGLKTCVCFYFGSTFQFRKYQSLHFFNQSL